MKHSNFIRRFTTAFFLLLFSLCITPKRFLHDFLANHRDVQTSPSLPVEQITASGYHCHIEDLVVVAPFLPGIPVNIPTILPSAAIQFAEPLNAFFISYQSHRDTRGSPVIFYA